MFNKKFRLIALFLIVLLSLSAFAGCAPKPAETTAAPAETTAAPAETTAAPAETTAASGEVFQVAFGGSSPGGVY